MPLPKPKNDETQKEFVARCMGNSTMIKDFKDPNQRVAVCYNRWKTSGMSENPKDLCEDLMNPQSQVKTTTKEMSGGFNMSELLKHPALSELRDEELVYYHDQTHSLWERLIQGYAIEWTFEDIAKLHIRIINEMSSRSIKHVYPVNNLDMVR